MLGRQSLVRSGAMSAVAQDTTLPCRDCASDHAQPWAELAALKRMQTAQAESLMMLVHELRSPAAASKSMVATLRYLNRNDAQLDGLLARIESRMDQLLDLVSDILDLSQAKARHPWQQVVVLDLTAETEAVCEPYLEEAAEKGVAMSVELPESPVWVRMAEQAYQLVLCNLISNAVKYTPAGSVTITLRPEGPWAVLEVEDSGIGIPQGEISCLFTEFFRASNARRSRIPGTGLGLAGVKALAERFEGDLEVASEEKKGSRFTVRLPLCRENTAL